MLYIIFATTESGIFGSSTSNNILWKNKDDLQFFKRKTTKTHNVNKRNAIIMGRKTADQFNKPLKNRINVVISSSKEYRDGFQLFNKLNDAIEWTFNNDNIENVYVIGGINIINETLEKYIPRRIYWNQLLIDESNMNDNIIRFDTTQLKKYKLNKSQTINNIV